LEHRPPAKHVDVASLMRDFLLNDEQPLQTSSGFGQPELVVFEDPRFYIQVLFWLDGTTQIHQHEFSGAFHVLAGSSLHSEFAFENARSVTAHFRIGDLRLQRTALLERGRTVPITSGGSCIHALFHLESPSITVVVRTHSDPGTGPQFTYLPPHVAVDPFFTDTLTTRRTQLLDVLDRTEDPAYARLVATMVADLDFERAFFIVQHAVGRLRELGKWDAVWKVFVRKQGASTERIAVTLDEILWRDRLVGLRGSISDPDHRFFLALLLNLPGRTGILGLVRRRFPGDPVRTIMGWAEELSETSEAGTWILDAAFPESAGVATEHQLPLFLETLRWFLRRSGKRTLPAGLKPGAVEAMRSALAASSLRALVANA